MFLKTITLKAYDFNWLSTCLKNHSESYTMGDGKSTKQKHHIWAKEIHEKIESLKLNADKFMNQLVHIFESNSPDYLNLVYVRNQAAKNYFYPPLKELSKTILTHIEFLKEEKQIKTYLKELLELEDLFYRQLQQLDKVFLVIENVLHNTDFNRQQLKPQANQLERLELVRQGILITEKADSDPKPKKERIKTINGNKKQKQADGDIIKSIEKKPDTKESSFNLYKEGKTITEIAAKRNMVITTIESHLAHYVSLGMIPVSQFVTTEKYNKIIECSKKYGEGYFSPIKQELGDDYSYSEIRFALATLKYITKN